VSDYDELTVIRLQQENDKLRAENAALRPLVSDLQHRLRLSRTAHDAAGHRQGRDRTAYQEEP
jgi:hypothetical protein